MATAKQILQRSVRSPAVTPVAAAHNTGYSCCTESLCRDLAQRQALRIHIERRAARKTNNANFYKLKYRASEGPPTTNRIPTICNSNQMFHFFKIVVVLHK